MGMGNRRAEMFNEMAQGPENKPYKVLEKLAIRPGQAIADVGSGGGYFTLKFARLAGKSGRVYAIDKNPGFLEFVREKARLAGLDNIETVLAEKDKLQFPGKTFDLIFVRNVYHHLKNRAGCFRSLIPSLKPGGRVAIIELQKGWLPGFHRIFGHYTNQETIVREMEEAGYEIKERHDFIPSQSFIVFRLGAPEEEGRPA